MTGKQSPNPNEGRARSKNNRQLLPQEAYTSEVWFKQEQRDLFSRTWSFVGMTEDLLEPGDFKCVEIGGAPYFLIRDDQNKLRAFHNVCRHRGSRLLEGSGNTDKRITCFYHHWSYDLDGALRGVPQERAEFPDLDKPCMGLLPVRLETWRNLISVNPDMEAEPLATWLADAPERAVPPNPEELVEVADLLYRIKANWKVVVTSRTVVWLFFE